MWFDIVEYARIRIEKYKLWIKAHTKQAQVEYKLFFGNSSRDNCVAMDKKSILDYRDNGNCRVHPNHIRNGGKKRMGRTMDKDTDKN